MTVDTQQWIIKVALGALAVMLQILVIGLLVLAALRDGTVADQVIGTIESTLQIAIPSLATLAGIHSFTSAYVATKQPAPARTPADGGSAA